MVVSVLIRILEKVGDTCPLPRWRKWGRDFLRTFLLYLALSFTAWIGSIPLSAKCFHRCSLHLIRIWRFPMVGMARCAVPARAIAGGTKGARRPSNVIRVRRLTLRSATGTARRAIPTNLAKCV